MHHNYEYNSRKMKKQINDLLLKMQTGENCIGETANELLNLYNVIQQSELFGERYPMTSNQPAQIDCRMTDCRFHKNGSCRNTAPALTFDDNKIICWTRISEPNCG